jgi:hypothetical protein
MLKPASILFLSLAILGTNVFAAEPAVKREDIEWTNIWIPHNSKSDLPRVLLVGDSICNAYYDHVANLVNGKAYVAKLATSGALQDPAYLDLVKSLLQHYEFAVIHFNNGLHGFDYTEEEYAKAFPDLLKVIKECQPKAKLVWATSTPMRQANNLKEFAKTNERVKERNKAVIALAKAENIPVNDLFSLVENHPEYWSNDGVHYNGNGQVVEAKQVAKFVLEALQK